jgi:hypothetical protein
MTQQGAPSGSVNTSAAIMGAAIGAVAGAVLWGIIGKVTGGWEFKYGAIIVGVLTGGGAALLGKGHTMPLGIIGAVFGLVGIIAGKALFEMLVHPGWEMSQHIAYHTTVIDFIFYGATVATGFVIAGTERGEKALDKVRESIPALRRN